MSQENSNSDDANGNRFSEIISRPLPSQNLTKTNLFVQSLCSERMLNYLQINAELTFINPDDTYVFLYLSQLEQQNLSFFKNISKKESSKQILDCITKIKKLVRNSKCTNIEFLDYSDLYPNVINIEKDLYDLYDQKKSFYRAVNNQVYRNLHPKLKKKGIKNSRDIELEKISPFLISELAALLYYTQYENFGYLLSTCKPMNIFNDLLQRKYKVSSIKITNENYNVKHIFE